MQKNKLALRLTESAIMIAAATILSMFKLVELPYGGSITLASMLPIVIIAYRYGTAWGILCGLVHGAIQLLLDPGPLSYVTGAASVVAVILLDYIVAFAVCGLAGIFRNMKKQSTGLLCGRRSRFRPALRLPRCLRLHRMERYLRSRRRRRDLFLYI